MKPYYIHLNEHFSGILSTRAAVQSLFENINSIDNQTIKIDFTGLDFISSSAAHEMVLKKREWAKKKIKVKFINMSPSVRKMMKIAERRRKWVMRKQDIKPVKILSENDFLLNFTGG